MSLSQISVYAGNYNGMRLESAFDISTEKFCKISLQLESDLSILPLLRCRVQGIFLRMVNFRFKNVHTEDDEFWSCAQTHPNQEQKALHHLRNQHFESFFPFFFYKTKNRHICLKPVFPGYIFIKLAEDRPWSAINNTHGVMRLLTQGIDENRSGDAYLRPSRIPTEFIKNMAVVALPEKSDSVSRALPLGIKVRVKEGIFAGREALVRWSDQERVRLLFALLGREVEPFFSIDDLEIISQAA